MAAEAEARIFGGAGADPGNQGGGDTFLTDLMQGKKQATERKPSGQSALRPKPSGDAYSMRADSEMNAEDIEDELRDVVFDYEQSKALLWEADGFLAGKPSYIGPGLDDRSFDGNSHITS